MNSELKEIYDSKLWKEIQVNFEAFDELITDDDLRDFYKRVIWQMVTDRPSTPTGGIKTADDKQKDLADIQSEIMRISLRVRQIGNKSNIEPLLGYANELSGLAAKIKSDDIIYPMIVKSDHEQFKGDGWISVEEQEPPLHLRILIWTKLKSRICAKLLPGYKWETDNGTRPFEYVEMWQPLPQPPQNQKES